MNPVVSIVIPCYNQARFLNQALQSVLDQNYNEWECIIVNDGSRDKTEEISEAWLDKDSRFRYFHKTNGGLSNARNYGISRAKGEFILPLDADDKISEDYVRLGINSLQRDNGLKVVYCLARKFGQENKAWDLPEYEFSLLAYQNIIFASAIFRKEDWFRVKGYDENMLWGYEDWDFWISLLKGGGKVKRLQHVGFYYRIKESSMLKDMDSEKREKMQDYISIKHADFFVTQIGSFFHLRNEKAEIERLYEHKLRSEKFVIDLFLYRFFKITLFGKYKPE